jgi:type II secretory pathway component PulM
MPALPLDEAGKYVAGAYVVFLTLVVVYVAIIGAKIGRIERELEELNELVEGGQTPTGHDGPEVRRRDQIAGLSARPPDAAPRR